MKRLSTLGIAAALACMASSSMAAEPVIGLITKTEPIAFFVKM